MFAEALFVVVTLIPSESARRSIDNVLAVECPHVAADQSRPTQKQCDAARQASAGREVKVNGCPQCEDPGPEIFRHACSFCVDCEPFLGNSCYYCVNNVCMSDQ